MKTLRDDTKETRFYVRRIHLEDAPVMEVPTDHWAHKGKQFRPDWVKLQWNHGEEPSNVVINGLLLRKDGTTGTATIALEYYEINPGKKWRAWPVPEWLADIINNKEA